MPNQNFCGPQDDMNLLSCGGGDLTKSFKSCQPSEKLCRFAYASWCPVCDLESHRRRSKSECIESHYRKRGRDMKTPSPRKKENEDGFVELCDSKLDSTRVRTNLCELPTTYIHNCQSNVPSSVLNPVKCSQNFVEPVFSERLVRNGDLKFRLNGCPNYPCKMESLLEGCGLPDTYSTNCAGKLDNSYKKGDNVYPKNNGFVAGSRQQPEEPFKETAKKPSGKNHPGELANGYSNVEATKIGPQQNSLNVTAKHPDYNASSKLALNAMQSQQNSKIDHRRDLTASKTFIYEDRQELVPIFPYAKSPPDGPCNNSESLPSSKNGPNADLNPQPNLKIFPHADDQQVRKCTTFRRQLPTPRSPNNRKVASLKAQPPDLNIPQDCREDIRPLTPDVNTSLDSKRNNRIRQRSESDNSPEVPPENAVETSSSCSVISKKAREVSPLEPSKVTRIKSAVKVASIIKNRQNNNKLSQIKLRKVRNKIAHSVSSDSNLSDSDDDFTGSDSDEKTAETCDSGDSFCSKVPDISFGSTPLPSINSLPAHLVGPITLQEFENWPLRPSLFPYVPPYIFFTSHDSEKTVKLPIGAARYFKWRLSTITPVVVRKTLVNTGFRLVRKSNDWIGTWGKHIKSVCFQSLKETQKLNHFPGTFQIGRKDRLWKNLQRLMFKYGHKEFGFIPKTFVLPTDMKLLRQAWEKTGHEKWIIKPPASARGTGIRVIHRWAHLPKKKSLVVQQYISNPYLINGSKFDLRLYVLVTSFNPLRIYLYPDGLARFASTKYSDDLSTLSDRYMHLTNYSINKLSSHYTANEDANACKGHKWTLSKLWEYLEKNGVNSKTLWRSLQQLVIKTILCGESSITQLYRANVNSRYNCYELFGVDVLLDERLKPWLLEVNISPSLHSASPLDLHVKGPLVQTLLNLAQFHLPPRIAKMKHPPPCLDTNLYSTQLTTKERLKQIHFAEYEKREEYLTDILADLTGDDVRHLTQAEDELTVIGNFERIFPTQHSYYYFQFMEVRYYNRLFDAWETRYEKNRSAGIKLLQSLCEKKLHLEVAPSPAVKNLLIETGNGTSTEAETTPEVSLSEEVPKSAPPVALDATAALTAPTTPRRPQTSPGTITAEQTATKHLQSITHPQSLYIQQQQ